MSAHSQNMSELNGELMVTVIGFRVICLTVLVKTMQLLKRQVKIKELDGS